MTTDAIVRAQDVWRQFGRHEALRGLNLEVPRGSAYALIGANGAGKTTTIKVLMNLISPTRGAATVMGVDSRELPPGILAQIGYVSESQVLPGRLSVGEYIEYVRPFYPSWDRELEASIRSRMQLPPERKISQLSHGMRLSLGLTCALPYRPKLLVLDEPFSGLDPLVREEFMGRLLEQAGAMTVLISTHELADIEDVATDVAFLDNGTLLFQESMSDLTGRVRRIQIVLSQEATGPLQAPPSWLEVRAMGNVLTFVETQFSKDELGARIAAAITKVRSVDMQPMPLRSIFTVLARNAQLEGS